MAAVSIRDVVFPLHTLDPDACDDSDLQVLRDVVGDARVVCLGESLHFASEFYRLRDRVLRFLVRELGFSAFVLESGLPEGLLVDDWVRGGPGDLAQVARRGITYAFGRCEEMHVQLRWMRSWNAAGKRKLGFYGMDVPGWCADPGPGVAACLARLDPMPGDRELLAAADLGEPTGAPSPDAGGTTGAPAGLARKMAELTARASAVGDDLALQCARGAERVVEFLSHGLYPGPGRNLRNDVMADNLRWILDREDRIVVGAHNVHLQRAPSFDGTAPVGSLLAPVLGDDLVVIGTTRGAGPVPDLDLCADPARRFFAPGSESPPPPHSLDAVLDAAELPHHLVDLRRTPPETIGAATAMSAQNALVDLDPRQAFDAIIHVRRITPAHGAADSPSNPIER
ncbi:erythromycin esterase family protein [Saccharopolyspora erythraea]|uniref:erythromycin esterase family protein n=1 Tax=Saccharopolyspora erythraea TaxID=1836 RepID=UPI001BA6BF2F|nr:erythromycin esterase family protein [Saccharopolyspora erythraea]QUH01288.1 erythromycin esterase family protein [Saccharopolyspora erythraea]